MRASEIESNEGDQGHELTFGIDPKALLQAAVTPLATSDSIEVDRSAPAAPDGIELDRRIGRGGMGVVYRGRQHQLDRIVAIKFIPKDLLNDPSFTERFRREAKILAKLTHPHISTIHDFGETAAHCYFVMEYAPVGSLRHRLMKGRLDLPRALTIARQIALALEHAHAHNVIHRDLKPDNVLIRQPLDETINVCLADFGLARPFAGHTDLTLTDHHIAMGTPYYMAPEQSRGVEIDHRADLFSLGVVLYEMLTGRLPIGRFPKPSEVASEIPARLDSVVMRCLAEAPEERFQNATALREELDALLSPRETNRILIAFSLVTSLAAFVALIFLIMQIARPDVSVSSSPNPGDALAPPEDVETTPERSKQTDTDHSSEKETPPTNGLQVYSEFGAAYPENFGKSDTASPSWEDQVDTLVAQYGRDSVVSITVDNINFALSEFIFERLLYLTRGSLVGTGRPNRLLIHLAPVSDLDHFVDSIDFGTVQKVDTTTRKILIRADHKRMPAPVPPIADVNDLEFVSSVLRAFQSWSERRKREAVMALLKVPPHPDRPLEHQQIAEILTHFLESTPSTHRLRTKVVSVLVNWIHPSVVPRLIQLSSTLEHFDKGQLATAFGRANDVRCLPILVEMMRDHVTEAPDALRQYGSTAEGVLIPVLKVGSRFLKEDAVRILTDIGTSRSLQPLRSIRSDPKLGLQQEIDEAIKAIESRMSSP